ncbi:bifunctional metallophosphatase/5'-nucleotidase [Domibacillus epiphyticus]|uniref:Bifunctional metallophosphatase/5'-nucleotidase n=1 Tax=Domibacillus epiphyticus TaxID=1714355 RepID=A0A1V2AA43_9BACI|nr:bifunctional UDP-sugar hydrolase/5'-nucleotidase [Domibacillus epiphyticus]OMP67817.1 bifunctional metallophosphatase/5'-nucleotidase [Domibacillus epiphyticus]
MEKTIHIYHTNDLHSHFENWPRIAHFLKKRRNIHKESGDYVFTFDIGDHVDRAHPLTEGTLGTFNVELLNDAKFDAAAIGNNEGITLPKEALNRLYEHAEFPVICANLFNKDGSRPDWALPYTFLKAGNVTIAVTSATAYYAPFYEQLDWSITHPIEELKKQITELKKRADIIIVLSHLGMYDDEKIAEETDADVILGAHTHHVFHEGKELNGTLLAAAGKYGYFTGHVEININEETGVIRAKRARVYETNRTLEAPLDELVQQEAFLAKGKEVLSLPVVHLENSIESDWFHSSPLPKLLAEALTEWCDADCSFINSGVVLGNLPAGNVTKHDLHSLLPHPINPCVIELTGQELIEVLRQTRDEKWPHLQIKGLGFRGKVMGRFVYDRIEMEGLKVFIDGKPLDMKKRYKLATLDMFTYGHYFVELHRAHAKKYFMPEFLRDVMEWKLLQL